MKLTLKPFTHLNENLYRHRYLLSNYFVLLSNYFVLDILLGVSDALMRKIDKDDPGLMVFPEGIMEAGCV